MAARGLKGLGARLAVGRGWGRSLTRDGPGGRGRRWGAEPQPEGEWWAPAKVGGAELALESCPGCLPYPRLFAGGAETENPAPAWTRFGFSPALGVCGEGRVLRLAQLRPRLVAWTVRLVYLAILSRSPLETGDCGSWQLPGDHLSVAGSFP